MSGPPDTQPELVVDRSRLESFLPVLGAEVTEDGNVRDIESGELVTTPDGEVLHIDEIGYLGSPDGDETLELVKDDHSSIVEYLSDHRDGEWEDPRDN